MKHKKLKLGVILTVALLAVASVGVTMATLQSETGTLTNTFEPGSVETKIVEDGEGALKKSRIMNTGENDCLVRVRVTISPAAAAKAIDLVFEDGTLATENASDNWDWSSWNEGDGYVYYTAVLPTSIATGQLEDIYTTYLFEAVKLKNGTDWKALGIETFDVTVYEESVQVQVYDPISKQVISALDESGNYNAENAQKVWEAYDANVSAEAE